MFIAIGLTFTLVYIVKGLNLPPYFTVFFLLC